MRRSSKILIAAGVVCLAIVAAWFPVVTPRLVKLPTDFNKTLHYTGTMTTYVDTATGQELATPTVVPMVIDRHVYAVAARSTSGVVVMREDITQQAGGRTITQTNQYAMDRRTARNVASPYAFALTPANAVDRSGYYRLNLPMNVGSTDQVTIYKNETGRTYTLAGQGRTVERDGLKLDVFTMNFPMTPVTAVERQQLLAQGSPGQLTAAQMTAQLQARGIDVTALAGRLLPALTPTEAATLAAVLTSPVTLDYYWFSTGETQAEPRTGADVSVSVNEGVGVKPDMTALVGPAPAGTESALAILGRHTGIEGVPQLITTLQQLASAAPTPAVRLAYAETAASVSDMAGYVKSQADKITLATRWLPIGIGVIGVLLLLGAAVVARRPRPPALTTTGNVRDIGSRAA